MPPRKAARKAPAPRREAAFSDSEGDAEDYEGDLVTGGGGAGGGVGGDELRSFMSKLGLPAAGPDIGFDDRDFRPPSAAAAAAAGAKCAPRPGAAPPSRPARRPAAPRAADAARKRNGQAEAAQAAGAGPGNKRAKGAAAVAEPPPPPAKPAGRGWAEGAGPPPAAAAAPPRAADAFAGPWYAELASLLRRAPRSPPPLPPAALEQLRAEAAELLSRAESRAGGGGGRSSAESAWLRAVRTSGTAADRTAAALVSAQADGPGGGRSLDSLIELLEGAGRSGGGKRGAGQALEALRELLSGGALLPPDRKLRFWAGMGEAAASAAAAGGGARARLLLLLAHEDALKARFSRFAAALAAASRDPLSWLKEKSVGCAAALLCAQPEGERELLSLLVNKLGDPGRRCASAAAHALAGVLDRHPAMKGVVVRDVAHFAFRPRIGLRAVYAAVVFLTQIPLGHRGDEPTVAAAMLRLYFDLFQTLLAAAPQPELAPGAAAPAAAPAAKPKRARKGLKPRGGARKKPAAASAADRADAVADASVGLDSRLLRALLTGVNRALPYVRAGEADALVDAVSPAIFRVAHSAQLGAAVQALTLLFQMLAGRGASSDRFYRAMYAALLAPALPRSASAALFLSLLFRAMKADVNPRRVAAMVKRLLQVRCDARCGRPAAG